MYDWKIKKDLWKIERITEWKDEWKIKMNVQAVEWIQGWISWGGERLINKCSKRTISLSKTNCYIRLNILDLPQLIALTNFTR